MKKFDFVVGNPPFDEYGDDNSRKEPLYHQFIDASYDVGKCISLIHPARFLFNAGQTPKKWNEKMLNDPHFKILYYEPDTSKVFPSLSSPIKGGVAISIKDNSKYFGPILMFTSNKLLSSILHKVINNESVFLNNIISPRGCYRTTDLFFQDYPEAKELLGNGTKNMIASNFFEKIPNCYLSDIQESNTNKYVKMFARINNKRSFVYIKDEYIISNDFLHSYNVALPKSNGSGNFGEPLSKPQILLPREGATDTFINIGTYESLNDALSMEKYIKTKFLRTMLGIKKVTQDNPRGAWSFVPSIDFSNSDIDWSKSIAEIDQQLYKKYGLSPEEIDFIEEKVQEME